MINCITINHKQAPLEIREQVCKITLTPGSESYILNTCNRTEIYWTDAPVDLVLSQLVHASGMQELESYAIIHRGREAVSHLFSVASGMESMVLGETQILAQVKAAYKEAVDNKTTGVILNKLLHRSFKAAKRIHTETDINKYPVSVASQAVELASHVFGEVGKCLIIGAGEMATIAAKRLQERGAEQTYIINRTFEHARSLAEELSGVALPYDQLNEALTSCDIVISSTGADEPIITAPLMQKIMKLRKNRPLLLIDIAVPRDIHPEVAEIYNCYLYDIDSLKNIVDSNMADREQHLDSAREIIRQEVASFEKWSRSLNAQDTIVDLYAMIDKAIQELDIADRQAATQLGKKLIHKPVSFLKNNPDNIEMVRRIFKLDEEDQNRNPRLTACNGSNPHCSKSTCRHKP